MKLKDVKVKVRSILEQYPEARENDGHLYALFLSKYHPELISAVPHPIKPGETIKMLQLSNFRKMPPLESLRRSRQIIQNDDGEFQPTDPKVRKARRIKEKNWKDAEVREARG